MKRSLRFLSGQSFTLMLLLMAGFARSQNVPEDIKHQFASYSQHHLQEKIFIHTDKSFYLVGEILWFKAYVVDAFFHKPIDLSKVAYIELIDSSNKPVLQAKISLAEGYGNGSLFLPQAIPSGLYKFRAYTKWMRNFPADLYFEKIITIINTRVPYDAKTSSAAQQTVQFFPEGGNLVNNIESRIAYKIVGNKNAIDRCHGNMVNQHGDTIMSFRPESPIGSFMFTPKPGDQYKAVLSFSSGETITGNLPAAYDQGYTMHVAEGDADDIKISVRSNIPGQVHLLAHTRGITKSFQTAGIREDRAEFVVKKNMLGDGISHFTIFNSDKKPVCERLFFKPAVQMRIDVSADQKVYESRKKIKLEISSTTNANMPVEASMSLAVYKVDSFQYRDRSDIHNYLWLESDLPGISAVVDFTNQNTVDELLLTYGWRRFKWDEVFSNQKPVLTFAPEMHGHIIEGAITDARTGAAASGVRAFLTVPATSTRFRSAVSDSNGNLKFEMKDFQNVSEIILQTNTSPDSTYRVQISSPFSENYSSSEIPSFSLNDLPSILDRNINAQVQHIFNGKNYRLLGAPNDSIPFYVQPNFRYELDNYTRFTTMEEVFREYVLPVYVTRQAGKPNIYVYDGSTRTAFDKYPLILVDGLPVFKQEKLMTYDPFKVRKIEVVSQKYFLGNNAYEGIVNLATYNGNLEGFELDPNAVVLDYEGLQLQREFYSPEYRTPEQEASRLPDFRNVLFWVPTVLTNNEGKQTIEFYSSDLPGRYAVVVQGITADGQTGSKTIFIEVQ